MRDGRRRAVFWLGVVLPDALAWALRGLLGAPEELTAPTRSPLGLLPWCAAGALLFEREWRARAFVALLLGAWLRLLVAGPVYWAFPFTMARVHAPLPAWTLLLVPLAEAAARRLSGAIARSSRSAVAARDSKSREGAAGAEPSAR